MSGFSFNEYAEATDETAVYPEAGDGSMEAVVYAALGLAGEAGEVAGEIKKILRDDDGAVTHLRVQRVRKEIGDVLWYAARLCRELDLDMDEIAEENIDKLTDRRVRGVLKGDGGDR